MTRTARGERLMLQGAAVVDIGSRSGLSARNPGPVPAEFASRITAPTWVATAVDSGSRSGLSAHNPGPVPAETAPPITAPTWVATAPDIGLVGYCAPGAGCVRVGAAGPKAATTAVDLDHRGRG